MLCPEASKLNESFTCNVTFNLGTNVKVVVGILDGSPITLYPPGTSLN